MAKQYLFGTGNLYLTPVGGGAPLAMGAIQDVSVSFDGDTKQLFGQYSFPLDTARGKTKITGKASTGQIDLNLYNQMFFGSTVTAGETKYAFNEPGSAVIPTTPFQLTVANAATFATDLGVFFALTGVPLKQVASGPVAGQYSVSSGGVYTFSTTDAGKAVVFNYTYASTTTGQTLLGTNTLMGSIPTFSLILASITKTKTLYLNLFSCTSSKLDLPFKQDDYGITALDFMAQDNGAGQVFSWSQTGAT